MYNLHLVISIPATAHFVRSGICDASSAFGIHVADEKTLEARQALRPQAMGNTCLGTEAGTDNALGRKDLPVSCREGGVASTKQQDLTHRDIFWNPLHRYANVSIFIFFATAEEARLMRA